MRDRDAPAIPREVDQGVSNTNAAYQSETKGCGSGKSCSCGTDEDRGVQRRQIHGSDAPENRSKKSGTLICHPKPAFLLLELVIMILRLSPMEGFQETATPTSPNPDSERPLPLLLIVHFLQSHLLCAEARHDFTVQDMKSRGADRHPLIRPPIISIRIGRNQNTKDVGFYSWLSCKDAKFATVQRVQRLERPGTRKDVDKTTQK